MKRLNLNFLVFLLVTTLFVSCEKEGSAPEIEAELTFSEMESDWVRLSLMRDGNIDLLQANSGEVKATIPAPMAEGARLYTSNSGQYLTVIERAEGKTRFFDSGIINHDDHGHENAVRWLGVELNSLLPTHYASSGGHIVIFNDGDGSISHIDEVQLEIPSYRPETYQLANTVAHHGAGFRLANGKFAATFKNTTQPGGIPQMVKFIDANGTVIDDNGGVVVTGIHGDAVNGKYGIFGATDGIILVDDQDNISLIPNIGGLNNQSGNWMGTVKGHDEAAMFFGRSRNVGVFMIDPSNKSLRNIYTGNDVLGDMFSFGGDYYVLHTGGNRVRVFDGNTGNALAERVIDVANIPAISLKTGKSEIETLKDEELPSPVLVASDKFLYVLAPNRTQIKVLELKTLNHVHTIDLDAPVQSMMKNGFSVEGDQNRPHNHG